MKSLIAASALFVLGAATQANARPIQDVCNLITSLNISNGSECVKTISQNPYFDIKAADTCYAISQQSSANGLACVKAIAGHRYQSEALDVCNTISSLNTSNGMACVTVVADKVYLNGSAGLCLNIAKQSSAQGLQCMKDSATVGGEVPGACPSIQFVGQELNASLDLIYDGQPRRGISRVQRLAERIDICLNAPGIEDGNVHPYRPREPGR